MVALNAGALPLAISALALVALVAVGCGGGDAGAERDEAERIVSAGELSSLALRAGDCFVPPDDPGTEVAEVEGVPCDEGHRHEVMALVPYDESELRPDDADLGTFADRACLAQFEPYVGADYLESSLFFTYLLPSIRSWNEVDDRVVVCVARSPEQELTTSVAGTGI